MHLKPHIFGNFRASKAACWLLVVFQCIFLNVVLPGHTRGAITLTGKSQACSIGDLGCPFCGHTDASKKSPTRQDQSDCAICHLAARITLPPVIDFAPPELGLADLLDPPAPESAPSIRVVLLLRERAPPVAFPTC
jgi:hypothetical protein